MARLIAPLFLLTGGAAAAALIKEDVSDCVDGEFYDSVSFTCTRCSTVAANSIPTADQLDCVCPVTHITCSAENPCWPDSSGVAREALPKGFECVACGSNHGPDETGLRCMQCGGGKLDGRCNCPDNHIHDEVWGNFQQTCANVENPIYNHPGPNAYEATTCPEPAKMEYQELGGVRTCRCQDGYIEAGSTCVDSKEWQSVIDVAAATEAVKIRFRWVVEDIKNQPWFDVSKAAALGLQADTTATTSILAPQPRPVIVSDTFDELYVGSAMFDRDGATVCRYLNNNVETSQHAGDVGWYDKMPWIFYSAGSRKHIEDTSLSTHVDFEFEFNMYLASYSLEGDWLGWRPLTNELELCGMGGGSKDSQKLSDSWKKFGNSVTIDCMLTELSLLECGKNPTFYELFVSTGSKLTPVPIRIENIIYKETRPNVRPSDEMDNLVLVRRFFMCEAVSGITGNDAYKRGQNPRYYRYASHVVFDVKTTPDDASKIYVPSVSIRYYEVSSDNLDAGNELQVIFRSEYSSSETGFWGLLTVLLIVFSALGLIRAVMRLMQVGKRYPVDVNQIDPGLFLPRAVIQLKVFLQTIVGWQFWILFAGGIYWVFNYKMAGTPSVLLPAAMDGAQYQLWDLILLYLVGVGILCLLLDLLQQSKTFFFFVDREPVDPKAHVPTFDPSKSSFANPQGFGNQGLRSFGSQNMQPGFGGPQGGFGMQGQMQHQQFGMQNQMQQHQGFGNQSLGNTGNIQMQNFGNNQTLGIGGMPQARGHGLMSSPTSGGLNLGSTVQPTVNMSVAPPSDKVSIWRALFVANEMNERIGETRTSAFVTWLLMAAFLEGMGLKNAARWQPSFETDDTSPLYNPLLMFGLSAGLWICIIFGQLIIRRVLAIFQGGIVDFIDIVALANVSVLVLDEPMHGYYVHGQAPGGTGDCSGTLMNHRLKQEREGLLLKRGMRPDDDLQTFETFFPPQFRANLFTLYSAKPKGAGAEERIDENATLRMRVQQFLIETLDGCKRTDKTAIVPMTAAEKVIGVSCDVNEIQVPSTGRLYEDQSMFMWLTPLLYGGTFFGIPSGSEWRLITCEVLLFNVLWRFTESVYAGILGAFVLDQVIKFVRQFLGTSALERTSFVDGRFLI